MNKKDKNKLNVTMLSTSVFVFFFSQGCKERHMEAKLLLDSKSNFDSKTCEAQT